MKTIISLSLIVLCSSLLYGCGSTKPFYKPDVSHLEPGKARIVFTREGQVLGSAVKIYVVDYSENVETNGILSFEQNYIHYPDMINVKLLWYDPRIISYVSKGPGADKHGDSTAKNSGFLHGKILIECSKSFDAYNMVFNSKEKEKTKNGTVRLTYAPELSVDEISNIVEDIRNDTFNRYKCSVEGKDDLVDCYKIPSEYMSKAQLPDNFPCILGFISKKNKFISFNKILYNVKVVGVLSIGQTIVWDRDPGKLKLAIIDYSGGRVYPEELLIESGKTYYIHYEAKIFGSPFKLIKSTD